MSVRMTRKILELLLCFLHPIAVVLIWIELLQPLTTSARSGS